MIRPQVTVTARVPSSVVVGAAWLALRVRLQCGLCRMQEDFSVRQWGEAHPIAETAQHVLDERDARAAFDAVAASLAAGWAVTADTDLRCFVCRAAEDFGATTRRAA